MSTEVHLDWQGATHLIGRVFTQTRRSPRHPPESCHQLLRWAPHRKKLGTLRALESAFDQDLITEAKSILSRT